MFVQEILTKNNLITQFNAIRTECSDFLSESRPFPFYKLLPKTYDNMHKVKVRLQRNKNSFTDAFNETFQYSNLRQRAIYTSTTILESNDTADLFFVFPINGYRFLYSKEVKNSSKDFQNAFDVILDSVDENEATNLIKDLLQYTYISQNLYEAAEKEAEVIFYNIPYYYAVRSCAIDYKDLLSTVT